MLQAIVADDDVDVRVQAQQFLAGGHSITPHDHRRTGAQAQQQRFIAAACSGRVRLHVDKSRVNTPVPARNDSGVETLFAQQANDGHHRGGLARAAGNQITDHDHRYRQKVRTKHTHPIEAGSQRGQQAKHRSHRKQQASQRASRQPGRLKAAFPAA